MRLFPSGAFDLACREDEWVGEGTFRRSSDGIQVRFDRLVRRGDPVLEPPMVQLAIQGRGNSMLISVPGDREPRHVWRRLAPSR
jgi:hypothetical protein